MNEKYIHSIIIGLLFVGLILTGASVYVLKGQIQSVEVSVKSIEQGMMDKQVTPALEVTEASGPRYVNSASDIEFGLTFDYPAKPKWYVTKYKTEMDQREAVRLTSSMGRLFRAESSGGPGEPGVTYFQEGFQMNIVPLLGDPSELEGLLPTKYPNIKSRPCDGAGCPDENYIFVDGKGVSKYEIRFVYTDLDSGQYFSDAILASMKLSMKDRKVLTLVAANSMIMKLVEMELHTKWNYDWRLSGQEERNFTVDGKTVYIPYDSSWGNDEYGIQPYDLEDGKYSFGPMYFSEQSGAFREASLRLIPTRTLDQALSDDRYTTTDCEAKPNPKPEKIRVGKFEAVRFSGVECEAIWVGYEIKGDKNNIVLESVYSANDLLLRQTLEKMK